MNSHVMSGLRTGNARLNIQPSPIDQDDYSKKFFIQYNNIRYTIRKNEEKTIHIGKDYLAMKTPRYTYYFMRTSDIDTMYNFTVNFKNVYPELVDTIIVEEAEIIKKPHLGYVYFIRAKGTNFIKIGRADNVKKRLLHLQVASPFELVLEKKIIGGCSVERKMHEQFEEYIERGEWFRFESRLKEYVESTDDA